MIAVAAALALASSAFAPGGTIPLRYTCGHEGVSPPLRWTHVPRQSRGFALSVIDPDAPSGRFTHWLVWGISARARSLPAGSRLGVQGRNDAGGTGYTGPCPPPGDPPHRYVFALYALRRPLPLRAGATLEQFTRGLRGRVVATARLVGRFGR